MIYNTENNIPPSVRYAVYSDASVLGANKAAVFHTYLGVYGWVFVDLEHGSEIETGSGIYTPGTNFLKWVERIPEAERSLKTYGIDTSVAETIAAIEGVKASRKILGGSGVDDKRIALHVDHSAVLKWFPQIDPDPNITIVVVKGHPTEKQLRQGYAVQKGLATPVSPWHNIAHGLCRGESNAYMRTMRGVKGE